MTLKNAKKNEMGRLLFWTKEQNGQSGEPLTNLVFNKKYQKSLDLVRNKLLQDYYSGAIDSWDYSKDERVLKTNADPNTVINAVNSVIKGLDFAGDKFFETSTTQLIPQPQITEPALVERQNTRGHLLEDAIRKETGKNVPEGLKQHLEGIAARFEHALKTRVEGNELKM